MVRLSKMMFKIESKIQISYINPDKQFLATICDDTVEVTIMGKTIQHEMEDKGMKGFISYLEACVILTQEDGIGSWVKKGSFNI